MSYQADAFPNDNPLHKRACDAAMSTMCPCPSEHLDLPHWKCVLRCCAGCPILPVPAEELNPLSDVRHISFHCYKNVTRCSKHGRRPLNEINKCIECAQEDNDSCDARVYTRKEMILMHTTIEKFHSDFYGPAISKLAFHLPHVAILGTNHCGKLRRQAFGRRRHFKDAKSRRDYAERLVAKFVQQIQSEYYGGNCSISIEGIALEQFKTELVDVIADETNDDSIQAVFYSFLSDESAQDGATTATHTRQLVQKLLDAGIMNSGLSTLWETTDGCAEQ